MNFVPSILPNNFKAEFKKKDGSKNQNFGAFFLVLFLD